MKKFIITADDYGMCPEVNSAIEQQEEKGILSTTNVLTNFQNDFSDSPLRKYRNFSVGIHWNVTTGKPVTDADKIPSLIDSQGNFHSIDEFRKRFAKGLINKAELKTELDNQYDIFYRYFGTADYWNTHENSSLFPKEFNFFEKVALEKNIRATRNFQRVYIDYDLCRGFKRKIREFAVSTFVNFRFGILARKNFKMPDGRVITFENISKTDIERMRNGLNKTHKKTIEIVIHPATSGDNPIFGNITSDRVVEFNKYMSDDFFNLFKNRDAEIISFNDL